jgi:hypothetical protein
MEGLYNFLTVGNIIAVITAVIFVYFQLKYFSKAKRYRTLYADFFRKQSEYSKTLISIEQDNYPQLVEVGMSYSDLNELIKEINNYVVKTKGTTDFSVIQNKVERKLNMRYDQSMSLLSFPTYLGLMGTFLGVFLGITMFISGFDNAGNISDDSIKNLLSGVLVSMFTSLFGLILTTINNAKAGDARAKIEQDKNEFFDYVQTELMPTLNVSLVSAIGKLHNTVDCFEPAFNKVIDKFQRTFDSCTTAFGNNFENNVKAVAGAVRAMGENMDKINENIQYQKELIQTMKSEEVAKGMERYITASNGFVSITQSLNKFEEARRMMLAAAQESINLQNAYTDSLKITRGAAVRINQILDRIKDFEDSINHLGGQISRREILGNDVVNKIQEQISAIGKKQNIADSYIETADDNLKDLFNEQAGAIKDLNNRYKLAIENHILGFEQMIQAQTKELGKRHSAFTDAIEKRLSIEDIRTEFVNLEKLKDINEQLDDLKKIKQKLENISESMLDSQEIEDSVKQILTPIKEELLDIKNELNKKKEVDKSTNVLGTFFGSRK